MYIVDDSQSEGLDNKIIFLLQVYVCIAQIIRRDAGYWVTFTFNLFSYLFYEFLGYRKTFQNLNFKIISVTRHLFLI